MSRNQELAQRWLAQAEYLLRMSSLLLANDFFAGSCFNSGQAVEMALKAFLYASGHQREAIHSIQELVERCQRYNPDFSQFRGYGMNLDPFYLRARYPDAWDVAEAPFRLFDRQAAEQALIQAEHIYEYTLRIIQQ